MRLVTFIHARQGTTKPRVGVLHAGRVIDLHAVQYARAVRNGADDPMHQAVASAPSDMVAFFTGGDAMRRLTEEALAYGADRLDDDELVGPHGELAIVDEAAVRRQAPVPRPRRMRDYLTYEAHVTGSGFAVAEAFTQMPICYQCNVDTVIGPDEPILWPSYTDQLDFELEVGFYVGKGGRDISVGEAPGHIAGVTIFNDVSARDIQGFEMTMHIGPSKGKDFCSAMGPCVVTMDEIDEWALPCTVRVNGEVWSTADTSSRRYSFAEVLAWASLCEPVYAGEFLAVGTVGGGCGVELDRWVEPGDILELEVGGIGTLRNPIAAREVPPAGAGLASFRGAPRWGR